MDARLLTEKVVRTLRREGLGAAVGKAWRTFRQSRLQNEFDRRNGTDTGGIEPLWKFRIASPNSRFGARYEATQEQELTAAAAFLAEDLRTFTFIDLGCGKGRTLLIASALGFKEVIGVEFAEELVVIARTNLIRMRTANVCVLHADAADYRFPPGNLVLYLYNPFSEEVLKKVLANLRDSGSKKLYIIYKAPLCAGLLDSSDFLRRKGCPPAAAHLQIWTTAD